MTRDSSIVKAIAVRPKSPVHHAGGRALLSLHCGSGARRCRLPSYSILGGHLNACCCTCCVGGEGEGDRDGLGPAAPSSAAPTGPSSGAGAAAGFAA